MTYSPTLPGASSRTPAQALNKFESAAHALAAWLLRIWRALCECAQRPQRQVPYY